jgi:hypothetical protein
VVFFELADGVETNIVTKTFEKIGELVAVEKTLFVTKKMNWPHPAQRFSCSRK